MANEQNEQLTLKELVAIHAAEFPDQANDVLEGYLEEIEEDKKAILEKLLTDEKYKEKFDEAITYTAFVIFFLLKKVLGGNDNFVFYLKEYLMSIRDDDEQIRLMRLYFMNVYSQKEIVTELLGVSDEVAGAFVVEVADLSNKYKKLLGIA